MPNEYCWNNRNIHYIYISNCYDTNETHVNGWTVAKQIGKNKLNMNIKKIRLLGQMNSKITLKSSE